MVDYVVDQAEGGSSGFQVGSIKAFTTRGRVQPVDVRGWRPTNSPATTWFAGYTPQVAAAVWVGKPDGNGHPIDGRRRQRTALCPGERRQ